MVCFGVVVRVRAGGSVYENVRIGAVQPTPHLTHPSHKERERSITPPSPLTHLLVRLRVDDAEVDLEVGGHADVPGLVPLGVERLGRVRHRVVPERERDGEGERFFCGWF